MNVWVVLGPRDEMEDDEPAECLVSYVGSSLESVGDFFASEGYESWTPAGETLDEYDYAVTTSDCAVQYHTVIVREVDERLAATV